VPHPARQAVPTANSATLEDWVVAELNRRGYLGAFGPTSLEGAPSEGVYDEELIVALCMPDSTNEGRHWKLVVRAIQTGTLNLARLSRLATMERADVLLAWLMQGVPAPERNEPIEALTAMLRPRGALPKMDYDFSRLIRQPAQREHGWRRPGK